MWIHTNTITFALGVALILDSTTAAVFRVKEDSNGNVYAIPKEDAQNNVVRAVEQRQVAPANATTLPLLATPSPLPNPMTTGKPPLVIAPPPPKLNTTSAFLPPGAVNGSIIAPGPVQISPTPYTYTLVTPSPSASPVAITCLSQVVPTYVPQITVCAPGMAPSGYGNGNGNTAVGSCSTEYIKSYATICATTLYGLATSVPITDCSQQVTFSSEYGYTLSSSHGHGHGAPVVQTLTTAYIAPWQDLTKGAYPTVVTQRVCSDVVAHHTTEHQCVDVSETWKPTTITVTSTLTSTVDLTTTVHGPSVVYINSYSADVTGTLTTLTLTSTMLVEYCTEAVSIYKQTMPTAYPTVNPVTYGWNTTSTSSEAQTTSTIVVTITSTVFVAATHYQTVTSVAPVYTSA